MGWRGKEIGRHQGRSQQWRWWRGSRRRRRRWQPLKERGQPVRQQWGEEDEEEPEDADTVGSNASTYAESDNSTVDSMPARGTKAEHWDCWQSVLQQTGFKPILGILETCTATQRSSWVTCLRVWAFLVSRIDCRFGVEERLQRPKDNCLWNQLQTTCRHIMETFLWANRADTTTKQPIDTDMAELQTPEEATATNAIMLHLPTSQAQAMPTTLTAPWPTPGTRPPEGQSHLWAEAVAGTSPRKGGDAPQTRAGLCQLSLETQRRLCKGRTMRQQEQDHVANEEMLTTYWDTLRGEGTVDQQLLHIEAAAEARGATATQR
ncbi:UNVERIFIED_CONTAM: hypothetical protein K2H54_002109 [Gekko kuhli]